MSAMAVCGDLRCAERRVEPVAHPDDPTGTKNRCPTCMGTVQWFSTGRVGPLRTLSADVLPVPREGES